MTQDDEFDERLRTAFAQTNAQITPDPAFTRRVLHRLGKGFSPRMLILGGAGATGSALASTQMERLADGIQLHNALWMQGVNTIGTQGMVALLFTLVGASIAWIMPRIRI